MEWFVFLMRCICSELCIIYQNKFLVLGDVDIIIMIF